ncbi:MAG: biotin synthase BioB [Streptococcaceae bacterium]|jgi:biotin synthase|nr:biotin synthase BioB [Streptococcaceae bacterium]
MLQLVDKICAGTREITKEEAVKILKSKAKFWTYYGQAVMIKNHFTKNTMSLNVLLNAKSGLCVEDCGYCAQSKESKADIDVYSLLPGDVIYQKAVLACKRKASTLCIATSGTRLSDGELRCLGEVIRKIKYDLPLKICLSIGLSSKEQIKYLLSCGVDRLNHNLNTPEGIYQKIASTHAYAKRRETLKLMNEMQMHSCSGFIAGMGESNEQLVELAFELKKLAPHAVPVNFLIPIKGTKLENYNQLTPVLCLKILTMMRFLFPKTELRASAGREYHLKELQPLALLITDSLFLGDYLTSAGQEEDRDVAMLDALEFIYEPKF